MFRNDGNGTNFCNIKAVHKEKSKNRTVVMTKIYTSFIEYYYFYLSRLCGLVEQVAVM